MKTIFKYQFWGAGSTPKLSIVISPLFRLVHKIILIGMVGILTANIAFGQRGATHKTTDSMLYIFAGVSQIYYQRQAFDQWTRTNFNIMEPHRPSVYVDLGGTYFRNDFGIAVNAGDAFQTIGGYVGRRITGAKSPVGSWLNIELGDFMGRFTNITPPTYNKVPGGQQLQLTYDSFYMSLTSKNYLNFLQYNARLGRARIPVNIGFFVSAGWQPGKRNWSYGYYDQDSVFHAQKLKPIPKLGKVQGTAGVFAGF
jgi:hypothetical protein